MNQSIEIAVDTRCVAFVQARLGSNRLPGKMLKPVLDDLTLLDAVVARLKHCGRVDQVVVVTSDTPADNAIADASAASGTQVFRGSEDDVLLRFADAAEVYPADHYVRVTGDCPLVDPGLVDQMIDETIARQADYGSVSPSYTFPEGIGAEILSAEILSMANQKATLATDREHVTPWIRRNAPHKYFKERETFTPHIGIHLSVDTGEDLAFISRIFGDLWPSNPTFGTDEVLAWLSDHLEEAQARQGTLNDGFYKSLVDEREHQPLANMSFEKSIELLEKVKKRIPSTSQTFSKNYTQHVYGASPIFVERGSGGRIVDIDGNTFIDYPLALGAVTIGHGDERVNNAVIEQLKNGISHSLPHAMELEVADLLCDLYSGAEMVRFGKNGSDVTAGAVRAARALTGREHVLACGYHGWQDWYIGATTRNKGVPVGVQDLITMFPYNNIPALERLFAEHDGEVAAVIMEPVGTVIPAEGYLDQVKALCQKHGALLIFDEIVTGFRVAMGGAQAYFGVTSDITCTGKGMGNGFPISAVMGRREVMECFDEIFFSFTFGGELASLVAAKTVIELYKSENVVSHMWRLGRFLMDGFNFLAEQHGLREHVWCQGLPPRGLTNFMDHDGKPSLVFKSIFQQECIKRGVLFNGQHKFCLAHNDDDVRRTFDVYADAFAVLKLSYESDKPEQFVEGKPIEPVFRQVDY